MFIRKTYSEPIIEKIVNNSEYKIPISSDNHQILQQNRLMLLNILKLLGLTKDQISELFKNPEMDIKELLFELKHGYKQEKKYCPVCQDLVIPKTLFKKFIQYYCPRCDKKYNL